MPTNLYTTLNQTLLVFSAKKDGLAGLHETEERGGGIYPYYGYMLAEMEKWMLSYFQQDEGRR